MTEAIDGINPIALPLSDAVGYDPASLTFTVYSENFDLVGKRDYTVQGYLESYTQVVSDVSTAQIEFTDPCLDPESVVSVLQSNPEPYFYSDYNEPRMQFNMAQFLVEPSFCSPKYSCSVISGERTDLC